MTDSGIIKPNTTNTTHKRTKPPIRNENIDNKSENNMQLDTPTENATITTTGEIRRALRRADEKIQNHNH